MKMLFPKRNRYFMLLLNLAIVFVIWYYNHYQKISTTEYINEKFVKHIKSFSYEPVGPVLWEEVGQDCTKFNRKKHWSIFKVSSVNGHGFGLYNYIYDGYLITELLIKIPLPGGDLKRGLIPRHLAKKVMRFREGDLIFVSWNTFLWDHNEVTFLPSEKVIKDDLCWNIMDELRKPTPEEIERYKNLYNTRLKETL